MSRPLPPGWTREHVGSCRIFYAERRCTCAWRRPAPVAAEGTDELREAVARWLFGLSNPDRFWDAEWIDRAPIYAEVDAGPLAPLLAKLRAVEALADTPDVSSAFGGAISVSALRRALGGESRG